MLGGATGLAVGMTLAVAGIVLAPQGGGAEVTTTTTVPDAATTKVWWHDPNETIVGTAAIVLESIDVQRDQAVLEYRVEPITSTAVFFAQFFLDEDYPRIAPESWVLETTNGDYRSSSDRIDSTRVRFDVDVGFSPDSVTGVRLERYRSGLPASFEVDLPLQVGAGAQLDDEVSVTIDLVSAQRSSVAVGVGIVRPTDSFLVTPGRFPGDPTTAGTFLVRALDPGWDLPTGRTPGPDTPDAWQLRWPDPTQPEWIRLQITGTRWLTVDADIPLDIRGMSRG